MKKKVLLLPISSDIAYNLNKKLFFKSEVFGTYRANDKKIKQLKNQKNLSLAQVNFKNPANIKKFISKNKKQIKNWDTCIISLGTMAPVGLFKNTKTSDIVNSININLTNQLLLIRYLLDFRKKKGNKTIITWAGPSINNASKYYLTYVTSKIALIKAMELMNHEIKDVKFTILGPGFVKTKLHKTTIDNPEKTKEHYKHTKNALKDQSNKYTTSFEDIIDCVSWVLKSSKKTVGGRNFSVKHDKWKNKAYLLKKILKDQSNFKLRRYLK